MSWHVIHLTGTVVVVLIEVRGYIGIPRGCNDGGGGCSGRSLLGEEARRHARQVGW